MKNGDKPAYPVQCQYGDGKLEGLRTSETSGFEIGISKREKFAMAAMQSLIHSWEKVNVNWIPSTEIQSLKQHAYEIADAMVDDSTTNNVVAVLKNTISALRATQMDQLPTLLSFDTNTKVTQAIEQSEALLKQLES